MDNNRSNELVSPPWPETSTHVDTDQLVLECRLCDKEDEIGELFLCCKDCIRNNIVSKLLWDKLGTFKYKNPTHFAVEFNEICDDINKSLSQNGLIPCDKFNIDQVSKLDQHSKITLAMLKSLYVNC